MKKEYYEKVKKIASIVTFVYVGIFIVVQLGVMILTVVEIVQPQAFLVELNTLIFFLMIILNGFALVNYCRNAGNPYLSEKNKKYVRRYKIVIVVWNLAFIIKFFMASFGVTLLDYDGSDDQT